MYLYNLSLDDIVKGEEYFSIRKVHFMDEDASRYDHLDIYVCDTYDNCMKLYTELTKDIINADDRYGMFVVTGAIGEKGMYFNRRTYSKIYNK